VGTQDMTAVLVKLAENAGAALILGGVVVYVVRTLRESTLTFSSDLKETRNAFMTFLQARDIDEDARAKETRAAFDRNTAALAVSNETNRRAVDVLGRMEERLDRDERRHGERRTAADGE
jgi:hypothetical protein